MPISAEVKASRKAIQKRWIELYTAAHGVSPKLDISLYGGALEEGEDLSTRKFFSPEAYDDNTDGQTDARQRTLLMQIDVDGDGPNGVDFIEDGVLVDPTAYEVRACTQAHHRVLCPCRTVFSAPVPVFTAAVLVFRAVEDLTNLCCPCLNRYAFARDVHAGIRAPRAPR